MSLASISMAALAAAHVGTLKPVASTTESTALRASLAWECELGGSARKVRVDLEPEGQWLTIDLGDAGRYGGQFRGVATRARYKEDDASFEAYLLTSSGGPYVYDFQLVTNQTTGTVKLTLTLGADAFVCATAE